MTRWISTPRWPTSPVVSRTVVWLHDVEGFTHKEIAKLMGKTESFSKSQLSRAYQRMKPMLEVKDASSIRAVRNCQELLTMSQATGRKTR